MTLAICESVNQECWNPVFQGHNPARCPFIGAVFHPVDQKAWLDYSPCGLGFNIPGLRLKPFLHFIFFFSHLGN